MAEPILIDYNGNQYDLALLRDNVLNNYDSYAKRFGYGKNKFQKDYQGLVEILRQLESGNARVETGRLVFNNTFADDKGAFGKARNKSKHYTNPAWMILDTIQKMDKYDKDKGKKKLTESLLSKELQDEIGDISSITNPKLRIRAQQEAVDKILKKYTNPGDEYIIDDEFDLKEYINRLVELQKALNTPELDDDNYIFNRLKLSNTNKPEEKKPEVGYNRFKKDMIASGWFSEADDKILRQAWDSALPGLRKKAIDSYFGTSTSSVKDESKNEDSPKVDVAGNKAASEDETQKGEVQKDGVQKDEKPNDETPKDNPKEGENDNLPPLVEYTTFEGWEHDYLNESNARKKKLLVIELVKNKDKITGIPKSPSKYNKGKSGFWYDLKTKLIKVPDGRPVTIGNKRRDGGYLKLLKYYKNG